MDIWQALILALVQGVTEFLPVSSSAHLILAPTLLGWQDQGLAFDVAVHIGTLTAVVAYFRHELLLMTKDWFLSLKTRSLVGESRLAWAVIFATIPAGLAGLFFKDLIEANLRSTLVIAITTIGFGLLLWYADRKGRNERDEKTVTWKDVLFIGCAQALALIPGTSRSGITITAALLMGLNKEAAARFSFLLSIPILLAAGGSMFKDLIETPVAVQWDALITGVIASAVFAYLTIHYFLKLLKKVGMTPFVIYRLALGGVLLVIALF